MALNSIRFGVAGGPAMVLLALAVGYLHDVMLNKVMLFAELPDACHCVLSSIWICKNKRFHPIGSSRSHSFADFRRVVLASIRRNAPTMRIAHLFKGFGGMLPSTKSTGLPTMRIAHLLKSSLGIFSSQARSSYASKIKAFFVKGLHFVEPVLLASSQEIREKHQFKDFKDECFLPILIPGALEFGVSVGVVPKPFEVFIPPIAQVNSASNVNFACGRADDFVDAAGIGVLRKHISNCLSLVPCLCVAREARLLPFRRG